jgi:transcriptional regulator with XRE-family HTH domain
MNREQAIEILKKKQNDMSLRQFAQELKVSPSYLSDIYLGRRQIGRKILRAIGMDKTVTVTVDYTKARSK